MFKLIGTLIFLAALIYALSLVTGTKFKDWLDWRRWKAVLTFLLKWLLTKLGDKPGLLQPYEIEQYMFRIQACSLCLTQTKCVSGCGCKAIDRMNVRTDSCSLGRFGPFLSEKEWNDYKEAYNVQFSITLRGQEISSIPSEGYEVKSKINPNLQVTPNEIIDANEINDASGF